MKKGLQLNQKQYYFISSANRTRIGSKVIEFVQDRMVQLCLIKQSEEQMLFEYQLLDQRMEGSALIHDWAADIEYLQTPLLFLTDINGRFIGMQGLTDLYERWRSGYRAKLTNKYRKHPGIDLMIQETERLLQDHKRLVQSFTGYNHFRCLFQSFYRPFSLERKEELNLKGFFGQTDLPLIVYTEMKQQESLVGIYNTAIINSDQFDRKSFVRMLKDVTNTYNLKVDLQLEMEESYQLNNEVLTHAELYLQLHVPDFYAITTAHQCKKVEKDEGLNLLMNASAGITNNMMLN